MHVVATAGHVDHGKSTLVRALTGMEPDRWEEERRRGLTLDLGFAWTTLPDGVRLAFVDVPGHERFVPTMLAGVGPVAAVMFVVAADEGWMPQSEEHLAAVDALGIAHGLLVVTRADLADPAPASRAASDRIARTSLGRLAPLAVSAVTGAGLPALLTALGRLVRGLPAPGPDAPVRLWVDRSFTIRGSGTVVTGTLPAGTVRLRDELQVTPSMRRVRVRGIQSLRETADEVSGVARVALNLRGTDATSVERGMALVSPGGWTMTQVADVRLRMGGAAHGATSMDAARAPRELTLHIGAARTPARVRMLGPALARLALREALPMHVGDQVLLRLPGSATAWAATAAAATDGVPHAAPRSGRGPLWPPLVGATVLDVRPPVVSGRGAAAAAGRELVSWPDVPAAADLLRRHGLLQRRALEAMGVTRVPAPVSGDWLADPTYWRVLHDRLVEVVAEHSTRDPFAAGMPVEAARAALGVPDRQLVVALAGPLLGHEGLLHPAGGPGPRSGAPGTRDAVPDGGPLMSAVRAVRRELARAPFVAPEAGKLRELGIDTKVVAAAARQGLLLRIGDRLVLDAGADTAAAAVLARLPQPFTTAQAREALRTTRRVAVPLLEHLDQAGLTERLPDDRRRVRPPAGPDGADPASPPGAG